MPIRSPSIDPPIRLSEKRTTLVDGRMRATSKHGKPVGQWEVMLQEDHEGYIDWSEYERSQKQLPVNA